MAGSTAYDDHGEQLHSLREEMEHSLFDVDNHAVSRRAAAAPSHSRIGDLLRILNILS